MDLKRKQWFFGFLGGGGREREILGAYCKLEMDLRIIRSVRRVVLQFVPYIG